MKRGPTSVMLGPTRTAAAPCTFLALATAWLTTCRRALLSRTCLGVVPGGVRPDTHWVTPMPTVAFTVNGRYCLRTFWSCVSVWLSRYRRRAVTAATSKTASVSSTTASTPARTRVRSWVRCSRAAVGRTRFRERCGELSVIGVRLAFQIGQAQAVAHRPLGMDHVRAVLGQLAPPVGHVGRDDGAGAAKVVVPHVIQYLRPGQHPARVEHQVPQQPELGRGHVDQISAPAHLVAVLV